MSTSATLNHDQHLNRSRCDFRAVIHEISELARTEADPSTFYNEVLQRIVPLFAASGGAFWTIDSDSVLSVSCELDFDARFRTFGTHNERKHTDLLWQTIEAGEPVVVELTRQVDDSEMPSLNAMSLLLAPLMSDGVSQGVLEMMLCGEWNDGTQQSSLSYFVQISNLISAWLQGQRFKQLKASQALWSKIDEFSREIHRSLDLLDTSYAIANEGRRLLGCDRVSLTVTRGRKQVLMAVSGQAEFDRRSNTASRLEHLANCVGATGESLWHDGSSIELPALLHKALDNYIDASHTKSLAIIPLVYDHSPCDQYRSLDDDHSTCDRVPDAEVLGTIILEQIQRKQSRQQWSPCVDLVCQHSARALSHALEYNRLFLMPVWRTLGRCRLFVTARNLPMTLVVSATLLFILLALWTVPHNLQIQVKGTLQPAVRRNVFVPHPGEVTRVLVEDNDLVRKGDPLLEIYSSDLERQMLNIDSDLKAAKDALMAIDRQLKNPPNGQLNLASQRAELDQRIRRNHELLKSLRATRDRLCVRSPITGVVRGFQLRNTLSNRPVNEGQVLMQVVDPTQEWELDLFLPEHRIGHLKQSQVERRQSSLPVSFMLKSCPGKYFHGTLLDVQTAAALHDIHGQSFRLRIRFDKREVLTRLQPAGLEQGAEVIAKIQGGRRSVGYCLFHDVIDWLRMRLFAL